MPVLASVVVGAALQLTSPLWSVSLTSTNVVTAVAIVVAAGVAVTQLRAFATGADRVAERVARARRATAVSERASREAAEDARVLHDTMINTLAAVAVGGAAVSDTALVRERSRRDLTAVRALLGQRMDASPDSLADLGVGAGEFHSGIRVRRTGLEERAVRALEVELSDPVTRALNGAVRELVRNAAKHARVESVVVDVGRTARSVVVTVTDYGIGFDGELVPGHGLAESVVARLAGVGAHTRIYTAPGAGTRVRIDCPLDGDDRTRASERRGASTGREERLIALIRWRACWLWSLATVLVGFLIEAVNRPGELTMTYAMLAEVGGLVALAWWTSRRDRVAPPWVALVLVAGVPLAYVAGMAGIGFGRGDVFHYQAWGLTPLLVVLLTVRRDKSAFYAGLAVLASAVLATTVVVSSRSQTAGVVMLVGGAPALLLAAGWLGFHRVIAVILHRTESDRRASVSLRLDTAAREAATRVRARWRVAELDDALELLAGLATGVLRPTDRDTRERCGREEAYLRQLTQLSPDAFRMSGPLMRALAAARARKVDLVVRTGGVDAPDDVVARTLGHVVLDAVDAVPTGSTLTVGLFPGHDGPQLTIVGPRAALGGRLASWSLDPEMWNASSQAFGEQEMIGIGWTKPREVRASRGYATDARTSPVPARTA